jgi:hypothetical protein
MLLDALDEAYEHVLIAGRREALRDLFVTLEGRIDVGLVIADGAEPAAPGAFLGFGVADLDIIRYEPLPQRRRAGLPALRGALM